MCILLRLYPVFCSCAPMTLIYELDLDILKMYPHIKNKLSRSRLSKVRARVGQTCMQRYSDTQTHARTHMRPAFVGGNKLWYDMFTLIIIRIYLIVTCLTYVCRIAGIFYLRRHKPIAFYCRTKSPVTSRSHYSMRRQQLSELTYYRFRNRVPGC